MKSIESQHGHGVRSSLMLQAAIESNAARMINVLVFAIACVVWYWKGRGESNPCRSGRPRCCVPRSWPRHTACPTSLEYGLDCHVFNRNHCPVNHVDAECRILERYGYIRIVRTRTGDSHLCNLVRLVRLHSR